MLADAEKSTFVTVLAWFFIISGGFSAVITIMQNFMLFFLFPKEQIDQAFNSPGFSEEVPEIFQFMFKSFDWFFLLACVLSIVVCISAVGLLKRKNWARIVFVCLMSFGILWNIGGFAFQFFFFNSMSEIAGSTPPPEFQTMEDVMLIVSGMFAFAFALIFGWIIKKLVSRSIKAEFA